jgi:hypothetical protein
MRTMILNQLRRSVLDGVFKDITSTITKNLTKKGHDKKVIEVGLVSRVRPFILKESLLCILYYQGLLTLLDILLRHHLA